MINYDETYDANPFYWGKKPTQIVKNLSMLLDKDSTILDLGCGQGRDSLYLASHGFKVTAIDTSKSALKDILKISNERNLDIKLYKANLYTFLKKTKETYDAIISINSLQFIPQNRIDDVIKLIKERTNPAGYNVILSFLAESKKQKEKYIEKNKYMFSKNELNEKYHDWQIESYREEYGPWETHGDKEKKHRHYLVKLLAQNL